MTPREQEHILVKAIIVVIVAILVGAFIYASVQSFDDTEQYITD